MAGKFATTSIFHRRSSNKYFSTCLVLLFSLFALNLFFLLVEVPTTLRRVVREGDNRSVIPQAVFINSKSPVPIVSSLEKGQQLPLPTSHYYFCGRNTEDDVLFSIYPELQGLKRIRFNRRSKKKATVQDIVVYGFGGYCSGWGKRKLSPPWFEQNFPGTTIIVNSEWLGFHSWQRGIHLGYGPADNVTSMRLHYGVLHVIRQKEEIQKRIFDPMHKQVSSKKRFLVYAASNCIDYREAAFDRLSRIDTAYTMGQCKGVPNITESVKAHKGHGWKSNFREFRSYRFCLVMENHNLEGYVTEKIFNAFMAGCIPIYYGTSEIFLLFNHKAFVFYDIDNPQPAIDQITYLNQNQSAYEEVMAEPILANGNETINNYFSMRDDIGGGRLKNRIRQMIDNARNQYAA